MIEVLDSATCLESTTELSSVTLSYFEHLTSPAQTLQSAASPLGFQALLATFLNSKPPDLVMIAEMNSSEHSTAMLYSVADVITCKYMQYLDD